MNAFFNQIRPKPLIRVSARQQLAQAAAAFFLGGGLGLLAKYLDGVPLLGLIGTSLGVWVLMATLLAAWSRSPEAAALHVFLFFAAMLSAYYLYSMALFGFFPRYYFLAWGAIALLAPFGAYVVWYARGQGWGAALCAGLPVAVLLAEGYRFYYTLDRAQGLDLLAALGLAAWLGRKSGQWMRILAIGAILGAVIQKLHMLAWLFGWI